MCRILVTDIMNRNGRNRFIKFNIDNNFNIEI